MARKALIEKEKRRQRLANQYSSKRKALKKIIMNRSLSEDMMEAKVKAQFALDNLPLNSADNRKHNRCSLDGRPRGYIGYFAISRLAFRKFASLGVLPGVRKISW